MCLTTGLFVIISLVLGAGECGLIIQPFLNLGYGYLVARHRKCDFRWADALKIIMASGTMLLISASLTIASAVTLGPFVGLINALMSVVYIPYRAFQIFPEGRKENPNILEDIEDIIEERKKGM